MATKILHTLACGNRGTRAAEIAERTIGIVREDRGGESKSDLGAAGFEPLRSKVVVPVVVVRAACAHAGFTFAIGDGIKHFLGAEASRII